MYSRAELKGSDHKPGQTSPPGTIYYFSQTCYFLLIVFTIFKADIRIVDTVKKAALSQLLLENIISTQPGENLDEKLASIALPDTVGECRFFRVAKTALCSIRHRSVPPPSTDEKAWWDTPGKFSFYFYLSVLRDWQHE